MLYFMKQKTAYEMRISDWSSDVCSSDLTHSPIRLVDALVLRRWVMVVLALLAVQIALGGWTSANYAALACANDFPKCVGQWWPPHDFREGFVLWRGIGVDYEGGKIGRAHV